MSCVSISSSRVRQFSLALSAIVLSLRGSFIKSPGRTASLPVGKAPERWSSPSLLLVVAWARISLRMFKASIWCVKEQSPMSVTWLRTDRQPWAESLLSQRKTEIRGSAQNNVTNAGFKCFFAGADSFLNDFPIVCVWSGWACAYTCKCDLIVLPPLSRCSEKAVNWRWGWCFTPAEVLFCFE